MKFLTKCKSQGNCQLFHHFLTVPANGFDAQVADTHGDDIHSRVTNSESASNMLEVHNNPPFVVDGSVY